MRTLIILTLSAAALAESTADIKENTKRNAEYRKLAAATRVAMSKQEVYYTTWSKDCESKGLVLSIVVPGDGRLDCIAKPQPQPTPKDTSK